MTAENRPINLLDTIRTNAKKYQAQVIVRDNEQDWTWQNLMDTGTEYAQAIVTIAPDLPKDAIVPVFVDRSGYTIAAILGVLLSGRTYAPLSLKQPKERIEACLKALNARILVESGDESVQPTGIANNIKRVPRPQKTESSKTMNLTVSVQPVSFLYVLFTSGSTGEPKGVMVDHKNIHNTLMWQKDIIDWNSDDVIGCATNFFFDISQFDLFTSLFFNIQIAIYSDPNDVNKVIEETDRFGITSIFSVPAFFSQFLRHQGLNDGHTRSLRRIISGGDFFPPSHLLKWLELRADVELFNVWGPTETSIVNTMHRVTEADRKWLAKGQSASVGKSHWRMPFVLLDEKGNRVVMPKERGEICMLGDCVTHGYINNPVENQRFYFKWEDKRAFRTQDLGWQDENGNLYIIGRVDSTVKISGYRVDLGEVEKAAAFSPMVYLAGAFTIEVQEGIRQLWIAVEPLDSKKEFDIYGFKKALRKRLPNYMIPKRVIVYPVIPKNENGKVDRRRLAKNGLLALEKEL